MLLFSILSLATTDEDTRLEVQWAPTEMSAIFLDNLMTEKYCGFDASRFKSCVAAADKFSFYTSESYEIQLRKNEFVIEQRSKELADFRKQQAKKRAKLDNIEKEFSTVTVSSLVKIYSKLRQENKNPKPHHVALPLNEFYAIYHDPHHLIQPTVKYDGLNHIPQKPYIGIVTTRVSDRVGVDRVYMNTSAELAGIKSGDLILKVNGKDLRLKLSEKTADLLNFKNEEKVNLTLSRDGRIFTAVVIFGYKKLSPIVDRVIDYNGKRFSYLYMRTVPSELGSKDTCDVFSGIFQKFEQSTDGLVLDLRGNLGGPGETAACLAGLFVGENKPIYIDEDTTNSVRQIKLASHPKVFHKKLVVLIDARTASSGEILANAIQFYGRGLLLGDRTFGKSIGQIAEPYDKDRVELFSTISKAYLPDGHSHQSRGVIPDFYVFKKGLKPDVSEIQVLREADEALYPLRLPKVVPVLSKSKPAEFPKTCVIENEVRRKLSGLPDHNWTKDFQLQFALKTLECITNK